MSYVPQFIPGGTPAQRPNMQGMIARMFRNYMTWGLGLIIAILVIIAIILAGIGMGFSIGAWSRAGDCDDDDGHVSVYCDDGNECTRDIMKHGTCDNKPYGNNTSCTSACYADETSEDATHVCTPQKGCSTCSICQGTTCAGTCDTLDGSDCPEINSTTSLVAITADCDSVACNYFANMTGLHDDTGIPCTSDSAYWYDVCKYEFDQGNPILQDNCLMFQPQCTNVTDNVPLLMGCWAWFACSEPLAVLIL